MNWAFSLALQLYLFIFLFGVFGVFLSVSSGFVNSCYPWLKVSLGLASSPRAQGRFLFASKPCLPLYAFFSAKQGEAPFFSPLFVVWPYIQIVYPLAVHIPLSASWLACVCTCTSLAFLPSPTLSLCSLPASLSLMDSLQSGFIFSFRLWCLAAHFHMHILTAESSDCSGSV